MGKAKRNRKRKRTSGPRAGWVPPHVRESARAPTLLEDARAASRELIETIAGTGRTVEESAKEFLVSFDHLPKPAIVEAIIAGGGLDRACGVADAAIATDPKSPAALWLAGRVALAEDDPGRAITLLSAAASDDPEVRVTLAVALWEEERVADALDELEQACRADPTLDEAVEEYGLAISAVAARLAAENGEPWPCPCGSGSRYHECCKPHEEAALRRFLDEEPLTEFFNRVRAYAREPALAQARADNEAFWSEVGAAELTGVPVADLPAAFLRGLDAVPVAQRSHDTVMSRFCFDVRTSAEDRERARAWTEHATYGVWHFCDDFNQPPGAVLHDEIGGRIHFAHPDPSVAGRGMLLGEVVPFDGVWRVAPGAMVLTDDEADLVRESVMETARGFLRSESSEVPDFVGGLAVEILDEAEPGDPLPEPLSIMLSHVVGTMLPVLVAEVLRIRASAPPGELSTVAEGQANDGSPPAPEPVVDEPHLASQAGESVLIADVKALLEILRPKGAKLTAKGHLSPAFGRALASLIGVDFDTHIGESVFKTRSTGEHARITLVVACARAAGLVRVVNRTMMPTKRAAQFGAGPLQDWQTLFDAFCEKLDRIDDRWIGAVGHAWIPDLQQLLPVLLAELYKAGGRPVSIEHLADQVLDVLHARYVVPETPHERMWVLADIGRRIVYPLALLGALIEHEELVKLDGRVTAAKQLVSASMTPLARWVLGGRRTSGDTVKRPAATREVTLHVALSGTEPAVWRRLAVPDDLTFLQLHRVLQAAMGWQDYHLFDFEVGGKRFGTPSDEFHDDSLDAAGVHLRDAGLVPGARFVYRYDFGDDWEHTITVEAIAGADGRPRLACLDGARACPPEDCGGVWGYAELLEALAQPDDPRHEEFTECIGGAFDPERFDVRRANEAVGFAAC